VKQEDPPKSSLKKEDYPEEVLWLDNTIKRLGAH
jgi:hypothetical protein